MLKVLLFTSKSCILPYFCPVLSFISALFCPLFLYYFNFSRWEAWECVLETCMCSPKYSGSYCKYLLIFKKPYLDITDILGQLETGFLCRVYHWTRHKCSLNSFLIYTLFVCRNWSAALRIKHSRFCRT